MLRAFQRPLAPPKLAMSSLTSSVTIPWIIWWKKRPKLSDEWILKRGCSKVHTYIWNFEMYYANFREIEIVHWSRKIFLKVWNFFFNELAGEICSMLLGILVYIPSSHESIAVRTLFSLEASIPNSNSTTTLGLELHVADGWSHSGRFHQFYKVL